MPVKHTFQSAKSDGGDSTLVRPSNWNADHSITAFELPGDLTPAQITTDQNDYNPSGLADAVVLRLSADQPRNVTGIAGGADGRLLILLNTGSEAGDIILKSESSSSTAANRFGFDTDVVISYSESFILIYDSTASRWRRFARGVRYTGSSFRLTPFYFADFLGNAGAATVEASWPWDYAVISSGTQSKISAAANHPGILRTTSSITANSGGRCVTDASAIRIAGGEVTEFVFRVITLTNTTIRMGFHDTSTSTDATDGVYIEIPSTGALVGKTAFNTTRSTTGTSYTISVSTWYRVKIIVNQAGTQADFYLFNDSGAQLWTNSLTSNIPTNDARQVGHGYVATNSGTTAVALIEMDYMSLEFTRALI